MNGKVDDPRKAFVEVMTGAQVEIIAGSIFHDTMVRPLSAVGAGMVYDYCRGHGFKIERA